MFKLKRLELLGFKSFADRTRLEFADGVAAVVGPNGCGKSNLSDAICWVLGEQSARMLRGERMADVIFNGTGARLPTGMAEVSLTLIDPEYVEAGPEEPEEAIPLPEKSSTLQAGSDSAGGNGNGSQKSSLAALCHRAGEMTVTRRLFRSGESEYLINGEISRLRDIQDLFMGTGLGPESYAIIEQGRIGQILSSKPSDRRAIIEEAAGVSKFKTRKRLAEAKLESSRQNLARITDILEEVTKQVNSLKRQASKARRYREMQEELRGKLGVVLTSRLVSLEGECSRLQGEMAAFRATTAEAARHQEALELEQKTALLRYEELEACLTELREQIAQGEVERQRLYSRLEQIEQQRASLEARESESESESERLRAQLAKLEQDWTLATEQGQDLELQWAAAQETATGLLAKQDELTRQAAQAESDVEACRQALLAAVSSAADLRNQLVQAEENGLAFERQKMRLQTERSSVEQELEGCTVELETRTAEQQRDEDHLAELAGTVSETAMALERVRQEEAVRRREVDDLREQLSAGKARRQALEESLARHAYSTESVRRLLSGNIPTNGHRFRPLGLLADFVEVSPGFEDVIEEFLQPDLDCVVVEEHDEARSGISLLRNEGVGRSTFFVTRVPSNGHHDRSSDSEVRNSRGVVGAVRDLVRFDARLGLNGDPALPLLEHAYLVEDSTAAERLATSYPACHFLTRSGEHYHHRLVTGGRGASAGPLALRRDFRELERRVSELESKLQKAEQLLSQAVAEGASRDEEIRRLTPMKLEAEKKAVLSREKLSQIRLASERAASRLEVFRNEMVSLDAELKQNRARQEELRRLLDEAAAEQAGLEADITRKNQQARDHREELDRLAQDLVTAQARLSALEERRRACDAERSRLAAQQEEVRAHLARLVEQAEGWRQEQGQLAGERATVQARLSELVAAQDSARNNCRASELESQGLRAQRENLAPRIEAARAELDAAREKHSHAEVALARAESDKAHLAGQCREELNTDPALLVAQATPESILAGEAFQAAEAETRELKARLENLGAVNFMALEELQEAEERFSFLETQRQDLLASIEDTALAIKEIDQVSRQQFLEAFQAINANFAESFRTLFGGGVAEMRLSDDADPDTGLDIAAQPPGKRLQNVLLLSGGEKALAALALLIALFRYTPSPFCVLDEVDAPLDESNVERFTRMIQQMSRHTQFILITHNKRTMEMAQVLYGVTMEEPGISKLVSVRMDEVVAAQPVAVPA